MLRALSVPVAEASLTRAAAAGVTKLTTEISEILNLAAAYGDQPVLTALVGRPPSARWRAGDVRSIAATNGSAPIPTRPSRLW